MSPHRYIGVDGAGSQYDSSPPPPAQFAGEGGGTPARSERGDDTPKEAREWKSATMNRQEVEVTFDAAHKHAHLLTDAP